MGSSPCFMSHFLTAFQEPDLVTLVSTYTYLAINYGLLCFCLDKSSYTDTYSQGPSILYLSGTGPRVPQGTFASTGEPTSLQWINSSLWLSRNLGQIQWITEQNDKNVGKSEGELTKIDKRE